MGVPAILYCFLFLYLASPRRGKIEALTPELWTLSTFGPAFHEIRYDLRFCRLSKPLVCVGKVHAESVYHGGGRPSVRKVLEFHQD
jgi:hypothetical protein